MPTEIAAGVLHITAATGGGADRYIRDLAAIASRPQHVLHVGSEVDVLEDTARKRFVPLRIRAGGDSVDWARWLHAAGIGIAHLHAVDEACRARLELLQKDAPLPYLVTLHDLQFVNPQAFEAPGMPARAYRVVLVDRGLKLAMIGREAAELLADERFKRHGPDLRHEGAARIEVLGHLLEFAGSQATDLGPNEQG